MIAPPVTPTLSQYGHRGEPIQPSETSVIDGVGEGEVVGDTVPVNLQSVTTDEPLGEEVPEGQAVALIELRGQ